MEAAPVKYLRVKSRRQMANKLIALNVRLDQIDKDKQRYNLREVAAAALTASRCRPGCWHPLILR